MAAGLRKKIKVRVKTSALVLQSIRAVVLAKVLGESTVTELCT